MESEGEQKTSEIRLGVKEEILGLIAEGERANLSKTELTQEEFAEICTRQGLAEASIPALRRQLHAEGVVYADEEYLPGRIVLDLRKMCVAVYALLERGGYYSQVSRQERRYRGQFTLRDMVAVSWGRYTVEEQRGLLGLMLSAGICFELGERGVGAGKEKVYLAPGLLPEEEPESGVWRSECAEGVERVFWRYSYDFLCPSCMSRVLMLVGEEYRLRPVYWRNGFVLPLSGEGEGVRALQSRKKGCAAGWITLEIRAREPWRVLGYIRQYFEKEYREVYRGDWRRGVLGFGRAEEELLRAVLGDEELAARLGGIRSGVGVRYLVSTDGEKYGDYAHICDMWELGNEFAWSTERKRLVVGDFACFFGDAKSSLRAPEVSGGDNTELRPEEARVVSLMDLAEGEEVVTTWLHLSDLHIGLKDARDSQEESFVMSMLGMIREKLEAFNIINKGVESRIDALFFTGDLVQTGDSDECKMGKEGLEKICKNLNLSTDYLYLVAGNHDLVRLERDNLDLESVLIAGREGGERINIDTLLNDDGMRKKLYERFNNFCLTFSERFKGTDSVLWYRAEQRSRVDNIKINIIGLNSSLLCLDSKIDKGRLALGLTQLNLFREGMEERSNGNTEWINICLTHHPMGNGWLQDSATVQDILRTHKVIHLCGHVHKEGDGKTIDGADLGYFQSVAGAAHSPIKDGVPHCFKVVALVRDMETGALKARTWPFVDRGYEFIVDPEVVEEGKNYRDEVLDVLT